MNTQPARAHHFLPVDTTKPPNYMKTQQADPFRADDILLNDLPRFNNLGQVDELTTILAHLVEQAPPVDTLTSAEALAAIRDLGLVMGAVKRWGGRPTQTTPFLGDYLFQLADKAECLHPRDNVFTFAVANPSDGRMRTYTADRQERSFIESLQCSMAALDQCLLNVQAMVQYPLHTPQCEQYAQQATAEFQGVIDALLKVRTQVTPHWFANVFVRNLEPIDIKGHDYHGPSADQTQMLVLDWLLYGSTNVDYLTYFDSLVQHLRPFHHQLMAEYTTSHGTSFLEIVRRHYATSLSRDAQQTTHSFKAVLTLLKRIKTFRYPHRKMAIDSFALREEDRQIGSGGLRPDEDLSKLIDWTEQAVKDFEAIPYNLKGDD